MPVLAVFAVILPVFSAGWPPPGVPGFRHVFSDTSHFADFFSPQSEVVISFVGEFLGVRHEAF